MEISKHIKGISLFFATLTIFSAAIPTVNVLASETINDDVIEEKPLEYSVSVESSEATFDVDTFIQEVESDPELSSIMQKAKSSSVLVGINDITPPGQYQIMGAKMTAAKLAIKAMIQALKAYGKKKWTKMVAKVPKTVARYFQYQSIMQVLQIAINFQGKVEDMLARGFRSAGLNSHWAGVASRLVVFFLM